MPLWYHLPSLTTVSIENNEHLKALACRTPSLFQHVQRRDLPVSNWTPVLKQIASEARLDQELFGRRRDVSTIYDVYKTIYQKTVDPGYRAHSLNLPASFDHSIRASNAYHIPEVMRSKIKKDFGQPPRGRTWEEAKHGTTDKAMKYLEDLQYQHARRVGGFKAEMETDQHLGDLQILCSEIRDACDDVVVLAACDHDVTLDGGFIAHLKEPSLCVFHPRFFSDLYVDGLKKLQIIPGVTRVEDIFKATRFKTLLHEVLQVEHVRNATDAKVHLAEMRALWPSVQPPLHGYICKPARGSGYWVCYSRYLCRVLAAIRPQDAEINAETYAIHTMLKTLQVAYPEYDFSGEYVTYRDELLHHFSGLDILRHPNAGSICDLKAPAYDPAKDLFKRRFGGWKPDSVEQLTEELTRWIEDEEEVA